MSRTQYANTAGAPYAGLILPVCALIVLSGCAKHQVPPGAASGGRPSPVNSPITVADGSMEVRSKAINPSDLNGNTLTISAGTDTQGHPLPGRACWIKIGGNPPYNVSGLNWTITAFDSVNVGTVTTTDNGNTVVAQGQGASLLSDGPGATFGVTFSPPALTIANMSKALKCPPNNWPRCRVWIDYWKDASACPPEAPCVGSRPCPAGYPQK